MPAIEEVLHWLTSEFAVITMAALTAVLGALGSFLASYLVTKMRGQKEEQREAYQSAYLDRIRKMEPDFVKIFKDRPLDRGMLASTSAAASSKFGVLVPESDEFKEAIENDVSELSVRLKQIEDRFPNSKNLQQITSVNEAILAQTVENLKDVVEKLEKKALTRWDVVVVVFAIFAAFSAAIGVVFAVISYLTTGSADTPN